MNNTPDTDACPKTIILTNNVSTVSYHKAGNEKPYVLTEQEHQTIL